MPFGTQITGDSASLSEAFQSVPVATTGSWFRRFLGFAGPGYLVSVGYMDPGNWGTDLEGGSKYGYSLLWVILVSSLLAQFLQVQCARLGLVSGKDLAQACRAYYQRPVVIALWVLCEIAIVACDLAEVVGSAVALNLLFGLPILYGVLITGLDVLMLLGLMRFGFRLIEAVIVVLIATIGVAFFLQLMLAKPDLHGVVGGLFTPTFPSKDAFFISIGILGATVMPHNLYLHSSLVQTRKTEPTQEGMRQSLRFNTIDTLLALGLAFFVNAAILVVAAAVFHASGTVVEELGQAHVLLKPLLGAGAATGFAVALLASGQSSTITGTLAGQIVMEGFLEMRIKPWVRRLITRLLAIIPAMVLLSIWGEGQTVKLLVISQVVLSLQLSFAIFPLLSFTSRKSVMGEFASPRWIAAIGFTLAVMIAVANGYLMVEWIGWVWVGAIVACMAGFWAWVRFWYQAAQAL